MSFESNTEIKISALNKSYGSDGKKFALKDVTMEACKGRVLALLGPNGAGKSTLINILSGMTMKTSGKVYIRNWDLDNTNDWLASRYQIGIVPQEVNFDVFFNPLDILRIQSGLFGIRNNDEYIWHLLDRLQLKEQARINTRALSGGMKRRLLIAKALVHQPAIIVLDEPTAGVDINLRWQLWDMIKEFRSAGKTVILTTHYLEEAEALADDVAIIHNGSLIVMETKNKLLGSEYRLDHTLEIELKNPIQSLPAILSNLGATLLKERRIVINYQYQDKALIKILNAVANSELDILTINSRGVSLETVFLELIKKHNAQSA